MDTTQLEFWVMWLLSWRIAWWTQHNFEFESSEFSVNASLSRHDTFWVLSHVIFFSRRIVWRTWIWARMIFGVMDLLKDTVWIWLMWPLSWRMPRWTRIWVTWLSSWGKQRLCHGFSILTRRQEGLLVPRFEHVLFWWSLFHELAVCFFFSTCMGREMEFVARTMLGLGWSDFVWDGSLRLARQCRSSRAVFVLCP